MNRLACIIFQLIGLTYCTDCPDGWFAFEGSCYLIGSHAMHFTEAESYCRQHGGNLVHVETRTEDLFLKGFIHTHLAGKDYWIGMTDETIEGVWRWYGTGTNVRFTDWAPTEPQDNGHGEDCAVFHHPNYQWADVPCASNRIPFCEKKVGGGELVSVIG
ncbi:perlucin-like [Ruditapes philippinarum]|uniref:perlucin-like n=1 Tax=Ruditapes philippinarum TaxID=129788 RepID=UPI00295A7AB5|nr:perlucin-like [Ruditapes philippinarum]